MQSNIIHQSPKDDIHHRDGIIIKNGRNVFRGELVCCVTDEEASLSYSTIADDNTSE
jgi:hypothetical protein